MKSLRKSLPVGFNPANGIKSLRVRDTPRVSVRTMTSLVFSDMGPLNMSPLVKVIDLDNLGPSDKGSLPAADFHPSDLKAGHVRASRMTLRLWGDGSWWFGGHLDDTSVVFGDNYSIGFSFEDGGYAAFKSGELGADSTSTPQHLKFAIEGRNENIQRNFLQVIQGRVKVRLHQSDDLGQVFENLLEDLKWIGRKLEVMVKFDSSSQDPPNSPTLGSGSTNGGGGEDDG